MYSWYGMQNTMLLYLFSLQNCSFTGPTKLKLEIWKLKLQKTKTKSKEKDGVETEL